MTDKPLQLYHVSLQYDSPMEGTVPVAATDVADAKKKIEELFSRRDNVKITDVYLASEVDLPDVEDETESEPSIN